MRFTGFGGNEAWFEQYLQHVLLHADPYLVVAVPCLMLVHGTILVP